MWTVGHDWTCAATRTPASGHVLIHQFVDTAVGDAFWTQAVNGPVITVGTVTVATSAPAKDRWQDVAVEVRRA